MKRGAFKTIKNLEKGKTVKYQLHIQTDQKKKIRKMRKLKIPVEMRGYRRAP